jgi:hypothetical protein
VQRRSPARRPTWSPKSAWSVRRRRRPRRRRPDASESPPEAGPAGRAPERQAGGEGEAEAELPPGLRTTRRTVKPGIRFNKSRTSEVRLYQSQKFHSQEIT